MHLVLDLVRGKQVVGIEVLNKLAPGQLGTEISGRAGAVVLSSFQMNPGVIAGYEISGAVSRSVVDYYCLHAVAVLGGDTFECLANPLARVVSGNDNRNYWHEKSKNARNNFPGG